MKKIIVIIILISISFSQDVYKRYELDGSKQYKHEAVMLIAGGYDASQKAYLFKIIQTTENKEYVISGTVRIEDDKSVKGFVTVIKEINGKAKYIDASVFIEWLDPNQNKFKMYLVIYHIDTSHCKVKELYFKKE